MKRGADGKFVKVDAAPAPLPWTDQVKGIEDEKARKWAERFTDLPSAVKAGLEFQQRASQREGFVRTPYEGMTEDEIKAWRTAAGVPDAPESYGIKLPDGMLANDADKEWFGGFLKAAHDAGVPRKGLETVLGQYFGRLDAIQAAQDAALATEKTRGHTEMRQLWGADYGRNVALAQRAATWAGAGDLQKLAEDIGIADHPLWIKAWATVGRQLAQNVPIFAAEDQQLTDNLERVLAEGRDRYAKGGQSLVNDPDYQKRRTEAYNARYPKGEERAA